MDLSGSKGGRSERYPEAAPSLLDPRRWAPHRCPVHNSCLHLGRWRRCAGQRPILGAGPAARGWAGSDLDRYRSPSHSSHTRRSAFTHSKHKSHFNAQPAIGAASAVHTCRDFIHDLGRPSRSCTAFGSGSCRSQSCGSRDDCAVGRCAAIAEHRDRRAAWDRRWTRESAL